MKGKILVIGIGPGSLEHMTGRAVEAIKESNYVVGFKVYIDLVKELLTTQKIVSAGMSEEVSRVQEAIKLAEQGNEVAVISSGDAGVYGMAGLIYEVLVEKGWSEKNGVTVEVVPGVSAINSCASLLGAPIMHDACTISLSDHLTPWEVIARRLEATAAADFVIALYNPKSSKRTKQIEEAQQILLKYRSKNNPVGLVKNGHRNNQSVVLTTLEDMLNHEIGMLSTVIIGNSSTYQHENKMITPRGYKRKYLLDSETQPLKPHERLQSKSEPWALHGGEMSQMCQKGSDPIRHIRQTIKAILFVGHGSKDQEGNKQILEFVSNMKQSYSEEVLIETCFLEFEQPTILQGIDLCVDKGAAEIFLIPLMLLPAGHSKMHIPNAIDTAKQKYPSISFKYGRPIGIHEQTIEICKSRLEEINEDGLSFTDDTAVILLGRGSSDSDANSDLYKISRLLAEKLTIPLLETSFIGVTNPRLEESVRRCTLLGAKRIIILPYFLFTGVLIKRLETMVEGLKINYPEVSFSIAEYFGFHPKLELIIKDRVEEVMNDEVKMNCDTCHYRLLGSEHFGDHHHHHHDENHDHDHHHHKEEHHHHEHHHSGISK